MADEPSGPQFIDTNILIYAHDRSAGDRHQIASQLVTQLIRSEAAATSIQALAEFYSVATRKLRLPDEEAQAIVADFGSVTLHQVQHGSLMRAITLRQRYKIAWWDALIITSALELNCSILWTEDLNHNQRFNTLTVKNPFKK